MDQREISTKLSEFKWHIPQLGQIGIREPEIRLVFNITAGTHIKNNGKKSDVVKSMFTINALSGSEIGIDPAINLKIAFSFNQPRQMMMLINAPATLHNAYTFKKYKSSTTVSLNNKDFGFNVLQHFGRAVPKLGTTLKFFFHWKLHEDLGQTIKIYKLTEKRP